MKTLYAVNKAAGGAIPRGSILKFVTDDDTVVVATDAADFQIGVLDQATAAATGDRVDVVLLGVANVLAGGTVVRGDMVSADSAGAGVVSDGTGRHIGFALAAAVVGDLFPVLLCQNQSFAP